MTPVARRALTLAISLFALAACSSSGGSADPTAICAESSPGTNADGDAVEVCEKLHPTRPFVRPPADEIADDGPSTLYLAAHDSSYTGFVERDGTMYRTLDAAGAPMQEDGLPATLRAPSKRHLFTIYRVTGTVDDWSDENDPRFTKSIRLSDAAPAILLEGRAIDGAFLGPWEGTVSKRAPDSDCSIATPCWNDADTVPLRVVFTSLAAEENIASLEPGGELLADGARFRLVGSIENIDSAVTGSDGACMPALTELGDASPFRPSTKGDVQLVRTPAMHAPPDDVLVLEYPVDTEGMGGANGMSALNVLHPANFLLETESEEWTRIAIRNHGTPNGSEIVLRPVTGGGGSC